MQNYTSAATHTCRFLSFVVGSSTKEALNLYLVQVARFLHGTYPAL
ncbi:hypothetical protein HRbin21_01475 [bacterium HR21]|nr:hypothetical protein HRbin21_01475 [bacterium HR21]